MTIEFTCFFYSLRTELPGRFKNLDANDVKIVDEKNPTD